VIGLQLAGARARPGPIREPFSSRARQVERLGTFVVTHLTSR
jgi:hypothetical protein